MATTGGTPTCLVQGTLLPNAAPADPGQYKVGALDATTFQGLRATIQTLTICNTDSGAHLVTLHLVASGGSPSAANTIFKAVPIAAGETLDAEMTRVSRTLETGDFISAFAETAGVVSFRADGEITFT